jgi:hypothetical protein
MRILYSAAVAILLPAAAAAQRDDAVLLAARAVGPTIPLKITNAAGSLRIDAWDFDSVEVRGRTRPPNFFFTIDTRAVKFGIDQMRFGVEDPRDGDTATAYHLVVHVPRHSQVLVRTASADITGTDISGWLYSASGNIQLRGSSTTLDVESINGSIDANVRASWMRARTGQGRVLIRGYVQDVDVSTVDGAIDIANPGVFRGRFASVKGDIRFSGTPPSGALYEFSNHEGAIDFTLPRSTSAVFDLTNVTGPIENALSDVRPAAAGTARSLRLSLGRGDAQVSVRSFKGPIRLRPQQP